MAVKIGWRMVVLVVFIGLFVGLVTGLVENGASQVGMTQKRYYGFPLIWRIVDANTGVRSVDYLGFFVDWGFGAVIASFMIFVAQQTEKRIMKRSPPPTKKRRPSHRLVDLQSFGGRNWKQRCRSSFK